MAPNLLNLSQGSWGTRMPVTIKAEPEAVALDLSRTALIIIDMQRDFLEPGGFGETLGNDVSLLGRAVAPCRAVLEAARAAGLLVIHTREGHRPDLSDAPKAKLERGKPSMRIGDQGPMGRILIRGEAGHDIISDGIALGSLQVPGDGQPIALLVDRQSTGGYPKVATVCSFDVGRLGQVRPGQRVRFAAISMKEAQALLGEAEETLARILV